MSGDSLRHRHPVDAAGYVMIWNIVMRDTRLSPAARLLYGLLCDFERGNGCFPSQETLAQLLGRDDKPCTIRTVFNHLAELKTRGLLTSRRRGQGRSNEYILEDVREVYGNTGEASDIEWKSVSTQIDRKSVSGLDRKPDSGPLKKQTLLKQKNESERKTLNVGEAVNCVDWKSKEPVRRSTRRETSPRVSADPLDLRVGALVEELKDWGSERRHRQLLSLCEQHGLADLPTQALHSTRERMNQEGKRGPLAKPGAYYARVLLKLLEDQQVFVPTAGEDDPEEVRRLIRESLGMGGEDLTGTK